jgi:hypothetical protein
MGTFNVDPDARYKVLPKGEYEVMIRSAEEKAPKQGEFNYIEVAMEIIAGEYKGELMIDRLSLSPKAAPRLAGFIHACGLVEPGTKGVQQYGTEDLVNKVLVIKGEPETFKGFEKFRPTSFKMHPDIARTAEATMNTEAEAARAAKTEPAKPASQSPAARAATNPARRSV